MRALLILFSIFSLIACGPRDDEKQSGGGTQSNLKDGETIQVTEQNQKLPSCNGTDDPTWNSIRLYYELNEMFNKARDLKLVLGKGSRNCVQVSNKKAIQIEKETGVDTGEFEGVGAFYYVTQLELMKTADFLANKELFKRVALGMGLSEEQLMAYVEAEPKRDEVTISYLQSTDQTNNSSDHSSDNSDDEFQLAKGQELSAVREGAKLESCSGEKDDDWQQVRLGYELKALFEKADQMTTQIQKGSDNCYRVSGKKSLSLTFQEEEGGRPIVQNIEFLVKKITLMRTDDFVGNSADVEKHSKAMGFEKPEELLDWLKDKEGHLPKFITITSLEKSEEKTPLGSGGPVSIFKLPEAQGLKAGPCQESDKVWDDMKIFLEQEDVFGEALKAKKTKALVNNGSFNCLIIGKEAGVLFKDTNNSWVVDENLKFTVKEVVIRDKADFIRDGKLAEFVASEVGIRVEEFLKYIEGFSQDRVNITRLEWVER